MTDEQIKEVLIGTQDYMLRRMPKTEWKHEYSPKFRRNMKKLIEKDKHLLWYYAVRVAAVIILLVSISGGLLIGFNEEVRAQVVGWIAERFTHNEYRYRNDSEVNLDITKYSIKDIVPKGYTLVDRFEEDNLVNEIYRGENGRMLFFTVARSGYDGIIYIASDDEISKTTVMIEDREADIYLSEKPDESNVIVWQGNDGILFSLQGVLTVEELIEMAEKVK